MLFPRSTCGTVIGSRAHPAALCCFFPALKWTELLPAASHPSVLPPSPQRRAFLPQTLFWIDTPTSPSERSGKDKERGLFLFNLLHLQRSSSYLLPWWEVSPASCRNCSGPQNIRWTEWTACWISVHGLSVCVTVCVCAILQEKDCLSPASCSRLTQYVEPHWPSYLW